MDYPERTTRWQKRFEVIINHQGAKIAGVMTNLSGEGMEVRVPTRFDLNDEVSVRIITPQGEKFHYLSEVRWWRPAIGERIAKGIFRHGLRHLAVDPDHARLVDLVQYNPQRRQEAQRFEVMLPVWIASNPELGEAQTVNISTRGLFLALPDAPPPYREDKIRLSLSLPDGLGTFQTAARVVHVMQPGFAQKLDFPPGIGVQFLNTASEEAAKLAAYLERLRAAAVEAAPPQEEQRPS